MADVDTMRATIQNHGDGTLPAHRWHLWNGRRYFDITVGAYDGHWFFLHTPAAGGTYRVEVFATDRAQTVTKVAVPPSACTVIFRVARRTCVEDPPVEDPPVSDPPADVPALELVAATTDTSLLVDPETGLAYVQDVEGEPILIRRSDDYWSGDVPLSRDGATLQAAARDELGRLRVLDVGPWGPFAWVLDESGMFSRRGGAEPIRRSRPRRRSFRSILTVMA